LTLCRRLFIEPSRRQPTEHDVQDVLMERWSDGYINVSISFLAIFGTNVRVARASRAVIARTFKDECALSAVSYASVMSKVKDSR
jgi:hypothetical protein